MSLQKTDWQQAPFPWQESSWEYLRSLGENGRLPHALLLKGAQGLGKGQFAVAFAHWLLCDKPESGKACGQCKSCQLTKAGTHPDLLMMEPDEPGKAIKVDQIRGVVDFMAKSAQFNGYRVVIVDPADAMNVNASNALLKSLEEPGSDTVLLLVSHQTSRLLPTIRSRCQVIGFAQPETEQAQAWLGSQLADPQQAKQLLTIASGAPLKALELSQSPWLAQRTTVANEWLAVLNGSADPVQVASKWSTLEVAELAQLLMHWTIDVARLKVGNSVANADLEQTLKGVAVLINPNAVHPFYEYLQQVSYLAAGGSNPNLQLLMEDLLIRWAAVKQ